MASVVHMSIRRTFFRHASFIPQPSTVPGAFSHHFLEKRLAPGQHPIVGRYYTDGPATKHPTPSPGPPTPPKLPSKPPLVNHAGSNTRHEVHEGSVAINIPFNPPGGGGGPGLGGSGSVFPLTNSPLLDAALTTVIGLGMGKSPIVPPKREAVLMITS